MARDETARKMVEDGATIVDVRSAAEFQRGHVDQARNIPVDTLPKGAGGLTKTTPVVVYCQSGMRSAKATRVLREAGFASVHDMGAMSNWEGGMSMPKILVAAVVLLALGFAVSNLAGCGGPADETPQITQPTTKRGDIDVVALKTRLEDHPETILIDVRTDSEWQSGHVPGARHMPLDKLDPTAFEKGPVHVICASGGRSSKATDTLVAAGIDAVNIKGGTKAWQAAGFPVE